MVMRPKTWRSARVICRIAHNRLLMRNWERQASGPKHHTSYVIVPHLFVLSGCLVVLRFLVCATFTGRQDLRRSECVHASKPYCNSYTICRVGYSISRFIKQCFFMLLRACSTSPSPDFFQHF